MRTLYVYIALTEKERTKTMKNRTNGLNLLVGGFLCCFSCYQKMKMAHKTKRIILIAKQIGC